MLLAVGILRSQTLQCRLVESHVRLKPFQASSNSDVGQFSVAPESTPITKVFRHADSGLDVSVGVEVFKVFKNEPTRIRIAVLPGSKTDQAFDAADGTAEAVSFFDNHWRGLSVNRTVAQNDLFYTFTFDCGRKLRKRSH